MVQTKRLKTASNQHTVFKQTARELGCDESETAFDGALVKIGKSQALPKQHKQKQGRKARRSK